MKLQDFTFLKHLQLPKCHLTDFSAEMISQIISKSAPYLIELDISWNNLNSHAMEKIISGLQNNTKIQTLNLSWNELSLDMDLKPLWQFIRNNNHLTHLDMSNTLHSTIQITRLIRSVSKSLSLQSVHLNNTPVIYNKPQLMKYIEKKLSLRKWEQSNHQRPNI